jgi:hypothetical protein
VSIKCSFFVSEVIFTVEGCRNRKPISIAVTNLQIQSWFQGKLKSIGTIQATENEKESVQRDLQLSLVDRFLVQARIGYQILDGHEVSSPLHRANKMES